MSINDWLEIWNFNWNSLLFIMSFFWKLSKEFIYLEKLVDFRFSKWYESKKKIISQFSLKSHSIAPFSENNDQISENHFCSSESNFGSSLRQYSVRHWKWNSFITTSILNFKWFMSKYIDLSVITHNIIKFR